MQAHDLFRSAPGGFALFASSLLLAACAGGSGGGEAPPVTTPAASSSATSRGTVCPGASSSAVQLATKTGTISGTLELPAGCGPFPVVLFHAGSGPTDRDGNGPMLSTDCTKQLASGLSSHGIASVRYDKRGIAASAAAGPASELGYTLDLYVDDAAAWVTQLGADARFKGVSIAGHSEGSLIGILAAQRGGVASFVSLEGAGRPAADVLRTQLAGKLRGALLDESNHLIDELSAGHTVSTVSAPLQSIFRPSVQPYLISWFARDPAKEIAKVKVPALVVQGTTDIQVGAEDAKLLAAASPSARLLEIPGMNHAFKKASPSAAEQQKAYKDPSLPILPELVEGVAAFLAANH
jgi:uncharacterized protein